jgi:murein DD-endopeptidase MepM/ murein hydrolase activator NlpD
LCRYWKAWQAIFYNAQHRAKEQEQQMKQANTALKLALCVAGLAACQPLDPDLRGFIGGELTTAPGAAPAKATARPRPDDRGILSYPDYQVAIARRGDTVADVAARVGVEAGALAQHNGLTPDTPLRKDEVLALPNRIAAQPTTTGPVDIQTLAGGALARAPQDQVQTTPLAPIQAAPVKPEPVRHKVERGETAYSIARLYNVNVRSLADWNGLGPDLSVREGQYLLIPIVIKTEGAAPIVTPPPGQGTPTPTPPSAAEPLPKENPKLAAAALPPSPNLAQERTPASDTAAMLFPVQGSITKPFRKGRNDGIDIAAPAGTPVKAADAGEVAAITKSTDQVPILVLRHASGLLTVYANIDGIKVRKGDKVKRGQQIAKVRAGSPATLHFEVRKGLTAVDPTQYLQ